MGREFELKYAATPDVQQAIVAAFSSFTTIRMETTYFDTPDGALARQQVTLRLRKENDATVCTLKTPLPDGSRGEWECAASDIQQGIDRLQALGAPAALCQTAKAGLGAVCGAKFTRLAAHIPTDDGMAELAVDSGVLLGGGKQIPLCEVEIEHKSGSDRATLALAAAIAAQFGLQPEKESKFRRALRLARGE